MTFCERYDKCYFKKNFSEDNITNLMYIYDNCT